MAIKHSCEINLIKDTFDEHKLCNAGTEIKDNDSEENIIYSIEFFFLHDSNLIMTAHFYILFV